MTVYNNPTQLGSRIPIKSPVHTKQPEFYSLLLQLDFVGLADANVFHLEISSLCFGKLPAYDPQPRNIELLL